MSDYLAATDLVVSRAGATAISEFLVRELPMILIPFPYAAEDHQRLNAKAVAKTGLAIVIENKDFTPEQFIDLLNNAAFSCDRMKPPIDAAERIVDYLNV
jgi:UDP-N-acetylglucosamine--N-acetylmuramyl-(pentapeptide) pyrophosphoryl-undecaprenol N-acetylglucosamine transferase